MKLCIDCIYCAEYNRMSGGVKKGTELICDFRTTVPTVSLVDGKPTILDNESLTTCADERTDSVGILGFFVDELRCGVKGKNFKQKPEQLPEQADNNEYSEGEQQ